MRHALALLAAVAVGFLLGALWRGAPDSPRADRTTPPPVREEPAVREVPALDSGPEREQPPDGASPATVTAQPAPPSAGTTGIIVDVVGVDGTAPETARVQVDKGQAVAWTPESRLLFAAPGPHLVRAHTPWDGARSPDEFVFVRTAAPPTPVTLRLLPRPSLHVRFVLPPGMATAEVHFYVRPYHGDKPPTLDDWTDVAVQDGFERVWRDAQPGRYLVAANYSHRNYRSAVREEALVEGDAPVTVTLRLPPEEPTIAVHVLGPNGKPVTNAHVRAAWREPGEALRFGKPAFARRDDGAYLLPPVPAKVPQDWPRVLEVQAPSYGRVLEELVPDGTVQLYEPGWVEVRISGAEGAHIVTELSIFRRDGRASDGRQGFGPLQPGRYTVRASAVVRKQPRVLRSFARTDVDVVSGETTRVVLQLPDPR